MTANKNIIADSLYGHFLVGLSRAGVYLVHDSYLESEIRDFLNRGIETLGEYEDIDSNSQVDHAIQQSERLGHVVAERSKEFNEGVITQSVWDSIVRYICPFSPFC